MNTNKITYTVLPGDNLSIIAKRFLGDGNKYTQIMQESGLNTDVIKPGDQLVFTISEAQQEYQTHIVKPGENLTRIAAQYGVDVNTLAKGLLNPDLLQPGQRINIPKVTTYKPVTRSFKEIEQLEEKLNQEKTDLEKIHLYHSRKHTGEYYLVDDKKNNKLSLCKDGRVVKSYPAIHGKNKGSDEMTITHTDANKKIINLGGNLSTPAGLYYTKHSGNYNGVPAFVRTNQDGSEIPSSIHVRTITENANTNGCTGLSAESMRDLAKYIKDTPAKTYILPVDNRNQFYFRNGEIQFRSGVPLARPNGTDRIVNGKPHHSQWDLGQLRNFNTQVTTPIKYIKFSNKDLSDKNKEIIKGFASGLMSNKVRLQKDLGINNDTYIQLAHRALGILGVESGFGNENSAIGNLTRAARKYILKNNSGPDYRSKFYTYGLDEDNRSVGLTQIRFSQLSEDTKKLFEKYGITKQSLVDSPQKAAVATMIKLATEFKNQGNNYDKAVRSWNQKPTYLSEVDEKRKIFNFYQQCKQGGTLVPKYGLGDTIKKGFVYIFNNKTGTFNEAFRSARKDGDSYFRWNGNLYNTDLKKFDADAYARSLGYSDFIEMDDDNPDNHPEQEVFDNPKKQEYVRDLDNWIDRNQNYKGIDTKAFRAFFIHLVDDESKYDRNAVSKAGYKGWYQVKNPSADQHSGGFDHLIYVLNQNITKHDIEVARKRGVSQAQLLQKYWNQGNNVTQWLHNNEEKIIGDNLPISQYGNNNNSVVDYSYYVPDAITDNTIKITGPRSLADIIVRARGNDIDYTDREKSIINLNLQLNPKFNPNRIKIGDTIYLTKPNN